MVCSTVSIMFVRRDWPVRSDATYWTSHREMFTNNILVPVSHKICPNPLLWPAIAAKDRRRSRVRLIEGTSASGLHQGPDFLRFERHVNAFDAEGSESIQYGIDNSGRCANTTCLAHTFGA